MSLESEVLGAAFVYGLIIIGVVNNIIIMGVYSYWAMRLLRRKPKQNFLLAEADEILRDYARPNSLIDMGNVFFAATEYKAAYEHLRGVK